MFICMIPPAGGERGGERVCLQCPADVRGERAEAGRGGRVPQQGDAVCAGFPERDGQRADGV